MPCSGVPSRSPPSTTEPSAVQAAAHPDGVPVPRRYWAIASILLAVAMSVLDSTIANVALPTIAKDFNASPASSIWVINSYQLAILISLLRWRRSARSSAIGVISASRSRDLHHRLAGLRAFHFVAHADDRRFFQGFGAACIMSVNSALVRFTTYPSRQFGRALGVHAFVVGTLAIRN